MFSSFQTYVLSLYLCTVPLCQTHWCSLSFKHTYSHYISAQFLSARRIDVLYLSNIHTLIISLHSSSLWMIYQKPRMSTLKTLRRTTLTKWVYTRITACNILDTKMPVNDSKSLDFLHMCSIVSLPTANIELPTVSKYNLTSDYTCLNWEGQLWQSEYKDHRM